MHDDAPASSPDPSSKADSDMTVGNSDLLVLRIKNHDHFLPQLKAKDLRHHLWRWWKRLFWQVLLACFG
jgi:hypothetical protein